MNRIVRTLLPGMLALAAIAPGRAAASITVGPPVATIATGRIQGVRQDDVLAFKGIPYAAPPVGTLRWQAPRPAVPWQGNRDATRPGHACIQPRTNVLEQGGDAGPSSEDCLYLNVWTPESGVGHKRPVMVWIHGGGLVFGASHLSAYDGAAMARRGAVVVTLNYRLGALGYFSHPAINGDTRDPVNFGLLDQIAALQWVRDNIAAFGGDPGNVTILGQSAGAQSVLALFASPPARGLFHKGIVQSAYGIPSHTRANATEVGVGIAQALGIPNAAAEALRAIPAERFTQLNDKALSLAPSLVVGDAAMPQPILATFQQGRQAKVPLIIGSTSDDGSVAMAFGVDPATVVQRLGAARIFVKALYPKLPDELVGRYAARDLIFSAFARRIAWLHSPVAPTWRYYFSHLPKAQADAPGVEHGADIPYTFDTLKDCACTRIAPDASDLAVARAAADYWYGFASTGAPTVHGMPTWLRDSRRTGKTMEFASLPVLRTDLMKSRLNLMIAGLKVLAPAK